MCFISSAAFKGFKTSQFYQDYNYSAPVGVRSIAINPSVCASVCLPVREHISGTAGPIHAKFCVQRSPATMTRSSSDGIALYYILPVLWMTSRLAVMGATPKGGGWHATTAINDMAIPGRSLMFMSACCDLKFDFESYTEMIRDSVMCFGIRFEIWQKDSDLFGHRFETGHWDLYDLWFAHHCRRYNGDDLRYFPSRRAQSSCK